MYVSLRNPHRISIQDHPNYRVVQVSDRQGQVGMLLPHANLVVPDRHAIQNLKQIIQFYAKLKPSPSKAFNHINDLPLFKNPSIA